MKDSGKQILSVIISEQNTRWEICICKRYWSCPAWFLLCQL